MTPPTHLSDTHLEIWALPKHCSLFCMIRVPLPWERPRWPELLFRLKLTGLYAFFSSYWCTHIALPELKTVEATGIFTINPDIIKGFHDKLSFLEHFRDWWFIFWWKKACLIKKYWTPSTPYSIKHQLRRSVSCKLYYYNVTVLIWLLQKRKLVKRYSTGSSGYVRSGYVLLEAQADFSESHFSCHNPCMSYLIS